MKIIGGFLGILVGVALILFSGLGDIRGDDTVGETINSLIIIGSALIGAFLGKKLDEKNKRLRIEEASASLRIREEARNTAAKQAERERQTQIGRSRKPF
jgi:hypothetical protein